MDTELQPIQKSWAKVRNARQAVTKKRITPAQVHSFFATLTLKTAVVVFRTCTFLKAVPFELVNNQSLDVRKFQSKWKLALWHFSNWLVYISVAFQLVTFFHTLRSETDINSRAVHTTFFVVIQFCFVFMFTIYMKPDVGILMLRQHKILLRTISDLGVIIPPWQSHPFVIWSVNYMVGAIFITWLGATGFYFIRPDFPCYVYSYLPSEFQAYLWVKLVCGVYELIWPAMGLSVVTAFFCYWCADIFTITSCVSALMKKTIWNANDIKLYKCLQVFCTTFNDFNGSFFTVGFTFSLTALPIIYIYMALRFVGVHILIFLVFPSMAVFNIWLITTFLPQHSKVRILSEQLVDAMKQGKRTSKGYELLERDMVGPPTSEVLALHKEMEAFAPMGIRVWFFGVYTLDTSKVLMEQMFGNLLLLLSL